MVTNQLLNTSGRVKERNWFKLMLGVSALDHLLSFVDDLDQVAMDVQA